MCIRKQDQNGFLLVCPAEVKNIPVLLKGHGAVCTYGINVVGIKDGKAGRGHPGHKLLTVPDK